MLLVSIISEGKVRQNAVCVRVPPFCTVAGFGHRLHGRRPSYDQYEVGPERHGRTHVRRIVGIRPYPNRKSTVSSSPPLKTVLPSLPQPRISRYPRLPLLKYCCDSGRLARKQPLSIEHGESDESVCHFTHHPYRLLCRRSF